MDKLNELKKFMMEHEAGSYENHDSFTLWNNIMTQIIEIQVKELKERELELTIEQENFIAEEGRPGK